MTLRRVPARGGARKPDPAGKPITQVMLYDIVADPKEKTDLSAEKPDITKAMRQALEAWRQSCRESCAGKDYK